MVRDFGGHGIGRKMHADPHVSHTGRRGTGPRLEAGMAITIEPMIKAQFEHSLLVTAHGCEVLTPAP